MPPAKKNPRPSKSDKPSPTRLSSDNPRPKKARSPMVHDTSDALHPNHGESELVVDPTHERIDAVQSRGSSHEPPDDSKRSDLGIDQELIAEAHFNSGEGIAGLSDSEGGETPAPWTQFHHTVIEVDRVAIREIDAQLEKLLTEIRGIDTELAEVRLRLSETTHQYEPERVQENNEELIALNIERKQLKDDRRRLRELRTSVRKGARLSQPMPDAGTSGSANSSNPRPFPCSISFYCNVVNFRELADGWVECDHPIPSTNLTKFFARHSYGIIAEDILSGDRSRTKAIITGTPGIGKSLFLIYLLQKLVKEGKRVLFIYRPGIIYFDGHGGVFEYHQIPPYTDHGIWTETLWCLFDAKGNSAPDVDHLPYNECNFVLSTSPKRSIINDFKKPPKPRVFYMPLWTKDELGTIAQIFPHSGQWEKRFSDLGGIPRFVLEEISDDSQSILSNACLKCDLAECIKIVGLDSDISDANKVVHALIHINSEAPFTRPSVQYASDTAFKTIIRHNKAEARRYMQSLLESCQGIPHAAALCGHIFEDHALELLQRGGTFTCRPLFDGRKKTPSPGDMSLVIPTSATRITADDVDATQAVGQLYVPSSKNFTALDAWIPGIGAFQMTVSRDHDIRGNTEVKLKLLGAACDVLYWLLPPPTYDAFTRKSPHTLKQFALLIPYPINRL